MASKEEREHEDQHVGHVAFRIPGFWPHDPSTSFRKIESKFRICNIRQSSTKYDHLLSALPTDICSSINDSLVEIDENAADAYEQLKALLMSRYTIRQSTPCPAAAAVRARRTTDAAARRPARGAAAGRPPGRTKKTATSASTTPPTANRR
jgi:hypothetical protein